MVDREGRFLEVNPGFEALFGFKQAEVFGRPLVDLIVPESGREAALRLQDLVRTGEAIATETERRCKDGRLVTVRVSVARPDVEGDGRVLFLYTDITQLRDAERALQAAQARLQRVVASSTRSTELSASILTRSVGSCSRRARPAICCSDSSPET